MLKTYWQVVKRAVYTFIGQNLFTQSAALAYYTIFALPSMLLVILTTTTTIYSETEVNTFIFSEIGALVGREGAQDLKNTLDRISLFQPRLWTTIASITALLFTSTTVFVTMQNTLNTIFQVKAAPSKSSLLLMLRDRFISFALLLSIAFILLVSLTINAFLAALEVYLQDSFGPIPLMVAALVTEIIPLLIITVIFAMILRFLPDVRLPWKSVWFGAMITTFLFAIGQHLIGLYIGSSPSVGMYDAAGSVLIIMIWTFYTSMIFFFGAVLTKEMVRISPAKMRTSSYAVHMEDVTSDFN